jgi:hypothetical protein
MNDDSAIDTIMADFASAEDGGLDLPDFLKLLCCDNLGINLSQMIPKSMKADVLSLLQQPVPDVAEWLDSRSSTELCHDDSVADQVESKVFAWLRLSPAPGTKCFDALHRCFPGALPGDAVMARCAAALESFGVTSDNVIYGQSICPDEINNEPGDLSQLMTSYFGNCFPMGGIGGAPYVGKTGFGAFSGHVPDDGHVVILFGPHLAISEDGELGMYLRDGQCKHTSACGAVLAAYNQCKSDTPLAFDVNDMQQSWLREKIVGHMDAIDAHEEPLQELMHKAYESVRDKLLAIVNTKFGSGKLVLLGGIQLNMPQPSVDHFLPLMFQIQSEGQAPENLLDAMMLSKSLR